MNNGRDCDRTVSAMNAVDAVDELVREYLLFRGLVGTLRAWEAETKADREKGFQAERVVDQLFAAISAYDLAALTDLWGYLDTRFFARLDDSHLRTVKRLELCLLRYYLVHAAQHSRRDKILEFFETLAADTVDSDDWAPWFGTENTRAVSVAVAVAVAVGAVISQGPFSDVLPFYTDPRRRRVPAATEGAHSTAVCAEAGSGPLL